MTVYIDPPTWPGHGRMWSHLVSDVSYAELHAFAAALDVPRRAFERDHYDLPEELIGKLWKGKWRGQRQRWFLFDFTGTDADIDIATAHPEFRAWKWAEPAELPDLIVPFKRELYRAVLAAFDEPLRRGVEPRP